MIIDMQDLKKISLTQHFGTLERLEKVKQNLQAWEGDTYYIEKWILVGYDIAGLYATAKNDTTIVNLVVLAQSYGLRSWNFYFDPTYKLNPQL